jgi:hypothetical protein
MNITSRAEAAFDEYVTQGPERTLLLLRDALRDRFQRPPTLRTLENWSARFGWQARLRELERRAREHAEQEHILWVHQHRERLRNEGLFLQQKGLEWLRDGAHKEVSAGESVRAIEAGFRLEALALGEATERIALEEHDDRIERLTDEELERLISGARSVHPGSAG